jgi:hypothetical protein
MTPFTCAREKEVAVLLHRGHWPQASAPELWDHVAACHICADLVVVTQTFQGAKASAAAPHLPSAGALWWRAQLRRRNTAIERINRPILGAQIFAFAITLVVAGALLAWQLRRGVHILAWLQDTSHSLNFSALVPASFAHLDGGLWLLFPVLATLALVSGVVVYFASEKR